MCKVRLRLCKVGMLRYISHRDLMRLIERASRRADLPLALTGGFNPHPKMSFGRALPVGTASEDMKVDITLAQLLSPAEVARRLNEKLPAEVQVMEATQIGLENPAPRQTG